MLHLEWIESVLIHWEALKERKKEILLLLLNEKKKIESYICDS